MAGRIDIMGRPILIPTYIQCKLTVYISVRLALRTPSASTTLLGFNYQSGQELVLIRVSKQGLVGTRYARSTFECGIGTHIRSELWFSIFAILHDWRFM